MLSRRNVRVKVMQALYSMSRDGKKEFPQLLIQYRKSINTSYELYLFTFYQFMEVIAFAKKDKDRKQKKLLPTDEDKAFTAKLFENELVQSVFEDGWFGMQTRKKQFKNHIDEDIIRKLYIEFAKTAAYKKYVASIVTSNADHKQMLLDCFKHCITNEVFEENLDDFHYSWVDDRSLVIGAIKKLIKALPLEEPIQDNFLPSFETTVEFGEKLLDTAVKKDKELLDVIEPALNNWDAERVAVVDMILLKMALSELIYFSTIPTKVTLNEFVEIAKQYSTDKSKDFINGILDRLMKKLEKDGIINKEGRGLID